ncbi:sigma 54-interacting transcriptional regulator [Desulfobacterota bacterium M19]
MQAQTTIMLVDDDEDFLNLLDMRVRAAGYETSLAQSGEEALAVLQARRPVLVVTDLRMAGMDGMNLFSCIRRVNPLLPVIIMTAHGSIPEAVEATRKGVFSFLTKPLNGRDLIKEIERALEAGSVGTDDGNRKDTSWRRDIISQSPVMEEVLRQTAMVAATQSNILIQGQSGTGKELLAKAVHRASPRSDGPFVAVNCGAIPEALLESELFGHVKGSFTGAVRDNEGLIKAADGGTLFLDEIGDTPPAFQVKLLRVIQERTIRSVGASQDAVVDVRIISATHRDLEEMVAEKTFREDLYYRLNVVLLQLPPLSERREDILLLARHFLRTLNDQARKTINGFAPEAMELLINAAWPGNIRQLYNVIEHAVALTSGSLISSDMIKLTIRHDLPKTPSFNEARQRFEQEYLINLLKLTEGNVSRAARLAQRNRTDFYKILQRNHIVPSIFKSATP